MIKKKKNSLGSMGRSKILPPPLSKTEMTPLVCHIEEQKNHNALPSMLTYTWRECS
jgi:hypothetical protein